MFALSLPLEAVYEIQTKLHFEKESEVFMRLTYRSTLQGLK